MRQIKLLHLPFYSTDDGTDNNKRLGSIRLFERFINDFNNADETPKQKCMDKFLNMKYMIYYYNDITERINKNSQGELVKFYKESETGFESYKVIHGDEMYCLVNNTQDL